MLRAKATEIKQRPKDGSLKKKLVENNNNNKIPSVSKRKKNRKSAQYKDIENEKRLNYRSKIFLTI